MKKKIMPPTYFIIFLILSIALHFILPIKKIIFPPYTYLGWLLIIFGIILNIWSDQLFKKSKTTVKPHEIPTILELSGPFRISRHPMYLGMILWVIGYPIYLQTKYTLISSILWIINILYWRHLEEKELIETYTEYESYNKSKSYFHSY